MHCKHCQTICFVGWWTLALLSLNFLYTMSIEIGRPTIWLILSGLTVKSTEPQQISMHSFIYIIRLFSLLRCWSLILICLKVRKRANFVIQNDSPLVSPTIVEIMCVWYHFTILAVSIRSLHCWNGHFRFPMRSENKLVIDRQFWNAVWSAHIYLARFLNLEWSHSLRRHV